MKKKILFWFPSIFYAALIFYFSSRETIPGNLSLPYHTDKAAHFLEYFLFGLCLNFSFSKADFFPDLSKNFKVCAIGLFYGFTDEIHQIFVPGRTFDVFDLSADFSGICGLMILLNKIKK